MFRTVIEALRSLDLATATVAAIPLATATDRWLPDRAVERIGVVVVPAAVAILVLLWALGAGTRPPSAAARAPSPEPARPVWLPASAAALLAVALVARTPELSRAAMALAISLALVAVTRAGRALLPLHTFAARPLAVAPGVAASQGLAATPQGSAGPAAEPARADPRPSPSAPASPPPAAAPPPVVVSAPDPEDLLRTLRSCMDEVAYAPGDPNVLSMTKRVQPDPAAEPAARARCARVDDGASTVLLLAGVLDALEVPAIRPTFDAVVADRRASVSVDLSELESIDSTGVGAVVGLLKRCRASGGTLRVVGARGQPLAVLRLLHLDRVLGLE